MRIPFRRSIEILLSEGPRTFVKELARTGSDRVKTRLFPAWYAQHRNIRIARQEWQAKALTMRAGPREMTITSTTYCNLKCVMCEHAIEGMVDRRHMDVDLVQKLATLIPTTDCFQLHGLGEPLLSPAFWKLLDEIAAVHRGVPYITINSNGLLLDEKTISRILGSKLKEINISIDAATADTYQKIRGGDFFKLIANVEALVQARRAARRNDFRILLNMTLMRANIEELPGFVRLAKHLGVDGIAFWQLNDGDNYERPDWVVDKGDWQFAYCDESLRHAPRLSNAMIREAVRVSDEVGMPIIDNHFKTRLVDEQDAGEDAPYRPTPTAVAARTAPRSEGGGLPIVEPSDFGCATACVSRTAAGTRAVADPIEEASDRPAPKSATIGQCDAPWRWLLVNERGDCSPCCYAQQPVGSLRNHSAAEIWNGPMMQEIRSSIAKGEVHRACRGASCRYVMGASQ